MELDELKKTWAALDSRLKEKDLLKETIILEIIQGKANKSFNKLLVWEIINLAACIVSIPVLWRVLERFENKFILSALIYTIVLLAAGIIWYSYKIHGLMKFDLDKSVSNNIYYINRYYLHIKWEKSIGTIATSILIIPIVLWSVLGKASILHWVTLSCAIIFTGLSIYWYNKRIYDKNIGSILKSLEELKALKEKE
ncbi:MAG: hypothetical protein LBL79_06455 [Prevotella sp.]|jgi:hypothetical protein|nr:hypothetical protein [Prevotella sp.]